MLRLPPFTLRVASTVGEAAKILAAEGPAAGLVAGGTDLWPNMKRRHQQASTVVSLMAIPELRGIAATDGEVRLGATTRLDEITRDPTLRRRFPALVRAVASISSPPLRNMGTIGGNVCLDTRCTYYNQTEGWRRAIGYCMKEAGSVCWGAPSSRTCWAHSASDSAPVLCALEASVRLSSDEGERTVAIAALHRNDGIEYLTKRPEEILTEIVLPAASDAARCRATFWKLRRRGAIDFAVLSVAAAVWLDAHNLVEKAAVFLGAVGSAPLPVIGVQDTLEGSELSPERIAEVAALARKTATPMDNTDFQAHWRGLMAGRYTEAALCELAGLEVPVPPPAHALVP
jgi:4-hydroxybenzoyl-CoA reductase subunit beta